MNGPLALRGPNFSGRSAWLAERRKGRPWPLAVHIGPYPESALTGLAWRVREELALATRADLRGDPPISARLGLDALADRELHVLSGGEIVRTALASALLGEAGELHVDIALEQLDAAWRRAALAVLGERAAMEVMVAIADNRLDADEDRQFARVLEFSATGRDGASPVLDPEAVARALGDTEAAGLRVDGLSFAYHAGAPDVLSGVSLALEAGALFLLEGPNGAGKTTFVRLLSGVLLPRRGAIFFGEARFEPGRSSRRHVALAFQNPDFQWTSLSLAGELARSGVEAGTSLVALCTAFGVPPGLLDHNPVDLPFAIKKRLGAATGFLSRKPWLVFDEPTLGQDSQYCEAFGRCVEDAILRGRGVIVITHDPRLVALAPHATTLEVRDRTIAALS